MTTTPIKLSAFIERKHAEGAIPIELSDGTTVVCPPPLLWSEEVSDAFEANDPRTASRLILGEEQWARFVADGGNWKILNAIFQHEQGADTGESSASSD